MIYFCQFIAYFINDFFVVWLVEDCRIGDEYIRVRRSDFVNVVYFYVIVYFQSNVKVRFVDTATYFAQFIQCLRNERLIVEIRVDGYQQDYIQFIYYVIQIVQRCRRVKYQIRFIVIFFNQLQRAVNMFGGFWMKGNDVGISGSEIRYNAIDGFYYQVYVDRGGNVIVT